MEPTPATDLKIAVSFNVPAPTGTDPLSAKGSFVIAAEGRRVVEIAIDAEDVQLARLDTAFAEKALSIADDIHREVFTAMFGAIRRGRFVPSALDYRTPASFLTEQLAEERRGRLEAERERDEARIRLDELRRIFEPQTVEHSGTPFPLTPP